MYKFFINRPITTWMFTLAFILFGLYGFKNIPVDRFPDVDFPFVVITTTYEGASPEVVDSSITKPIEDQLSKISGIEAINSQSFAGVSRITVIFNIDKDLNSAVEDVRDAINRVSKILPEDADTPIVQKINTSVAPIMAILLHGKNVDYEKLSYYADKVVKREFERINGVGGVALGGFQDLVMWVRLNPEKMESYKITPQDVITALRRNNLDIPAGRIDSKDKEYVVRILGKIKDEEDLNNLIIKGNIKLKDIGYAKFDFDEVRSIVRFKSANSKKSDRAIALIIYKQTKTNTVNVADRVKEKIKELNKKLPDGIRLDINYDSSEFVKKSVKDAIHEIIVGAILTAITIFLFLGSLRMTFIPFMAIPVSLIGTVFLMYLFGYSLNTISLMAMAVAVGLVIDDAIVVMESIFRRKEEGLDSKEAAIVGTRVVIFAILASTASLIAIFIPVLFMKSVIGKFFSNFAFVLITAIAISYIISLSFTPSVSRYLVKVGKENIFRRIYSKFENIFDITLRWSLNHKLIVIFIAFITIIGGFSLNKYVKKEFFPIVDEGRFIVRFETPTGSSFEFTNQKAKEIEKILQNNPYILRYGLAFGEGIVGRPEVNGGMFFITLVDREKRPHQKIVMKQLREQFSKLKDIKAIVDLPGAVGAHLGRSADIMYIIKGPDLKQLANISSKIIDKLQNMKGYVDVDTDIRITKPEIEVLIDRDKAIKDGVSIKDISDAIQIMFSKYVAGSYEKGSESYDLAVKIYKKYLNKFDALEHIYIRTKTGELVPVDNYIRLNLTAGYNVINRYNKQYAVTIYANLQGKSTGEAIKEVEKLIKENLPIGYTYEVGGQTKEFKKAFSYLGLAVIIAVIAIYMILASLFESLLHPFAVLLMVPFSIFGIFGFIILTNTSLNVASYFGIILLVGIITRDAVLFIDRIVQLKEKLPIREAILQARKERLRPILMTTFTIIASLIPVAFGLTTGSEMRQPIAIAIIGGLITALPLSLYVIPIIYEIFDKVEMFIKRKLIR
ncbi:efflux RND transporter permease subunit [Hydrogenothermus marinus]|uniref:HAE1 family hydrophobic/amphiphilic exporter-1 n=1 Tax=Hydrogenothermus marinus TaxID=133270 RepID=A0A3M0BFM4_9AQUI|nr:efflux RND transporter permease subunit [Hydrogenothermus marinus]RMA96110.1 HAE1 family hydrophobic/amphiphilic exporter-1 [Hydrogenothermus marinus]